MLPTDTRLTKARIIYQRNQREFDKAKSELAEKNKACEASWLSYVNVCKGLGYCAFCEKTKEGCQCMALALGKCKHVILSNEQFQGELGHEWIECKANLTN
jgi:hypothetical protein